jgi:hypothetical protein
MWGKGVNEMTQAEALIAEWGEHFPVAELGALAGTGSSEG